MQTAGSQVSTPHGSIMVKFTTDKIRNKLLSLVEQEKCDYIQRTDIKFNSKKPLEIFQKYLKNVNRKPSSKEVLKAKTEEHFKRAESLRRKSGGSEDSRKEEKKFFSKLIQEIGKDFIDLRKKDVGIKKMEKVKKLTIDTNLSFVEAINSLRSSTRRKSTTFRFSHINIKQKIEEIFMSKEEKDAKNIQDNFNKIQIMVRQFKKAMSKDMTGTDIFKDQNSNFIKFSEELFDILEFKGIKFDPKVISSAEKDKRLRGSYDIPNPFLSNQAFTKTDAEKVKSKSIVTDTWARGQKNLFAKKTNNNCDFNDNIETNVNSMGNSPLFKFGKRKSDESEGNLTIESKSNLFRSPMIDEHGFINYESNRDNVSEFEAENRISSLYESDFTPINYKAFGDSNNSKTYVNLIRCKRPSHIRCDSEVSKFSEVSKSYEGSRNVSYSLSREPSLVSNDSISEVSNDFEFNELNNSCS
jgi:hypothetical protein